MEVRLQYEPFPVHVPFHLTLAREKAAFGSVGSGKTIALCADGVRHMLEWPGSLGLLARDTVPALRDSTEAEFVGLLATPPPDAPPGTKTLWDLCTHRRTGGHIGEITFPNGSTMLLRSLDAWTKIMSMNLSWIGVDEANEIDYDTYLALRTRLRRNDPLPYAKRLGYGWPKDISLIKQQIALAANAHGHNWMWSHFVNDPQPGTRFFKSSSFDNPTLFLPNGDPGPYLRHLLHMPTIWVRRMVFCEFDAFAGQIFQVDADRHTHAPFTPPPNWERAMGMDWGLRSAVAIVWWAREPGTQKWYQYREWSTFNYFNQSERESAVTPTVDHIAKVIKDLEAGETVRHRAADPDIWRRRTGDLANVHIASSFGERGIYFTPGAAGYEHRIEALNALIESDNWSCATDCPITMTAIQQYQWEDLDSRAVKDGPERPLKKNDHHVDASQYLATLFLTPTRLAVAEETLTRDQLLMKRAKENLARRQRLRSVRR